MGKSVVTLWHRIVIRNGAKYDKVTLLRELVQRAAVKFIPICYMTAGQNSSFFVEDTEAARAIKVNLCLILKDRCVFIWSGKNPNSAKEFLKKFVRQLVPVPVHNGTVPY